MPQNHDYCSVFATNGTIRGNPLAIITDKYSHSHITRRSQEWFKFALSKPDT